MKTWIGATIVTAAVAGASALGGPVVASTKPMTQTADAQRTTDFSVRRYHRRYHRQRYRPQPHYYARPYYYRPYPYSAPAPFTFGFGFGPG